MTLRKIDLEEISRDMRLGLGDVPIMEKYHLEPGEFMWLLEKLKELDAIDSADFNRRMQGRQSEGGKIQKRAIPRTYLLYNIPIYDMTNLSIHGVVTDLTKEGLQIMGIEAEVGEVRNFVIRSDLFPTTASFGFEAVCKWMRIDRISGDSSGGFEITTISNAALRELAKITNVLGVSEAGTEPKVTGMSRKSYRVD